jgi:hypothetical protein
MTSCDLNFITCKKVNKTLKLNVNLNIFLFINKSVQISIQTNVFN